MKHDYDRIERFQRALEEAQLDALICTLPAHVLMMTGYWPVVGASIAIATREGRIGLIIPDDEEDFARQGWAEPMRQFKSLTLDTLQPVARSVAEPLKEMIGTLGLRRARIGYEADEASEPASYVADHYYGEALRHTLNEVAPEAKLSSGSDILRRLAAVKTPMEIDRIRTACGVGHKAFDEGAGQLQAGLNELETAARFRIPLSTQLDGAERADGFAFCMSGPNGAEAYAAYQRSRRRVLRPQDLVLIHCNSYVDGFWTDITRTYCLGEADARQHEMYDAVFAARAAALDTIRPGVPAAEVDLAARNVLQSRGFGEQFKNPTGHGAGFFAIDHHAKPVLHPKSEDVLEKGMVFNVEPAIYIDHYAGMRHCDMVAVTDAGADVLTPFHSDMLNLQVRP